MSINTVSITWLSDSHDCEQCGGSWAEGADVVVSGPCGNALFSLSLEPTSACYDGDHYDECTVLRRIIEKLGFKIEEGRN